VSALTEKQFARAHAVNARRTAEAQELISAARADPTDLELEAEMQDLQLKEIDQAADLALDELKNAPTSFRMHDENGKTFDDRVREAYNPDEAARRVTVAREAGKPTSRLPYRKLDPDQLPSGMILVTGPRAVAYLELESASKAALETQTAHAAACATLRAAIETLCRAMAPAPTQEPERKPGVGRGDE
jgi:hypothetical protein